MLASGAGERRRDAQLGKYQLIAAVGTGGMAEVFLAVSQGPMGFNKLVVVKRLRVGMADDPVVVEMFLDEAKLAARLSHPNIVHTFEIGEEEGAYFIAMEYLAGQPLRRIAQVAAQTPGEPVMTASLWARVIADALDGLHYAHELKDYDGTPLQIVHRDISPHNIFLTYEGQTKLVDFGIAKATINSSTTETGMLKGKPSYLSPEHAAGRPVDRRADVFSMGIVLWELLAQRRLFEGDTVTALHKVINLEIPKLVGVVSGVDDKLEAIIMRSLERDPDKRYGTALEMRTDLESWLHDQSPPATRERLAGAMTTLFEDARKAIDLQIQEKLAQAIKEPTTSSDNRVSTKSTSRSGLRAALPDLDLEGQGTLEPSAGRARTHAAQPTSARVYVGAAVAVAIGAAIVSLVLSRNHAGTVGPATSAPASSSTSLVHAAARFKVRVTTTPQGALVECDGQSFGTTPAEFELESGTRTLRVSKDGYQTQTAVLTIIGAPTGTTERHFSLEPKAAAAPTASPSISAKPPVLAQPTPKPTMTAAPEPTKAEPKPTAEKPKPNVTVIE